jgi:small-conductance mechanosensitive channel
MASQPAPVNSEEAATFNDEPVSPDEPLAPTKEVREALDDVAPAEEELAPREHESSSRHWLLIIVALLVAAAGFYGALKGGWIPGVAHYTDVLERLTTGAMSTCLVLGSYRVVDAWLLCPIEDAAFRYNLRRIIKLFVGIALFVIALSMLFANWYTAAASLGLVSLILGFSLQTPITSFIGWIYILARRPYRVGDRIMIGSATGDVIDVAYLDTTLWEVGGPGISKDHPSGRIIKFPNAKVLQSEVYNYSWPLFPYVWNEITFHVAYQSDLGFVEETMRDVVEKELGEAMMARARSFREILARTPVDEVNVRDRPSVSFRVDSNSWLDATVRYIVPPKEAGPVKTRLIKTMLARLNAQPDRVKFPMGNSR